MRAWVLLGLIGSLGGALGCAADSNGSANDGSDCSGDVPDYADVAIFEKCNVCHSSQLAASKRMNAPTNVNFDTEAAAEAVAREAVGEVRAGGMPPRASDIQVTEAEKAALYKWAACMAK